ncbi:hypothetical protein BJV74DRAFT_878851 [Russula compacta]|nr:hypothetical protein BJV74DRAFT_878851 [Russula compacta]
MNRPVLSPITGQPPQRPPSLGPAPGIGAPFRGPYPTYALPPRNIVPAYPAPGLQNHRTTQSGFVQPRTPGFPFGGATPQQQQQQQQQSQSQQSHPQLSLPPHQPPTNAHPSLSHLQSTTPSIASGGGTGGGGGTAPSVSSTSELGLDPNDFPALGATPSTATSTSNPTPATSYASQAGTGLPPSGSSGAGSAGSALPRDFTADDFPALGGGPAPSQQPQQQSSQQQQQSSQGQQQQLHSSSHDSHPPGLSGLPGNHQQQQQQQPGLLNLGPRVLQGLQSEAEKQRHTLKLNAAAQAAWNQPNATVTQGQAQSYQNGTQQQPQQSLHAPPGVPPPSSFSQQPTQQQGQSQAQAQGTPFVGNGTTGPGNGTPTTGHGGNNGAGAEAQGQSATSAPAPVPQTPAQQVLMSAADRWGLLGLLAMIKNADPDQALLSVGTDLGTMGLDMQQQGNLYSTFITPWADSSAAHTVEPDYHLPGCYNVQPPPPGSGKAAAFSDETLFFMFYSSPRDALQEIAAQELYNRNWRYHKELRIWLTKESGTAPSQKVPGGEQGTYTFWDPDNWGKERKEMVVLYADLEEKNLTAPPAATFVAPGSVQQQQQGQQGQGLPQLQQMQMGGIGQIGQIGQLGQLGQLQPQVRGAFQGVSMAAM